MDGRDETLEFGITLTEGAAVRPGCWRLRTRVRMQSARSRAHGELARCPAAQLDESRRYRTKSLRHDSCFGITVSWLVTPHSCRRDFVHFPDQDMSGFRDPCIAGDNFMVIHRSAVEFLGFTPIMFHDCAV